MYSFQRPAPSDIPSLFAMIVIDPGAIPIPLPSSSDLPGMAVAARRSKPRKTTAASR